MLLGRIDDSGINQARSARTSLFQYGSNCELETQILLSGDLGYIEAGKLKKLQDEIGEVERMLKALIKSLETRPLNPRILES